MKYIIYFLLIPFILMCQIDCESPIELGEDITTCNESVTLDAGEGYDSYEWSTGEDSQTIEISESGDYSVEVSNTTQTENNYSMSFDGLDR